MRCRCSVSSGVHGPPPATESKLLASDPCSPAQAPTTPDVPHGAPPRPVPGSAWWPDPPGIPDPSRRGPGAPPHLPRPGNPVLTPAGQSWPGCESGPTVCPSESPPIATQASLEASLMDGHPLSQGSPFLSPLHLLCWPGGCPPAPGGSVTAGPLCSSRELSDHSKCAVMIMPSVRERFLPAGPWAGP